MKFCQRTASTHACPLPQPMSRTLDSGESFISVLGQSVYQWLSRGEHFAGLQRISVSMQELRLAQHVVRQGISTFCNVELLFAGAAWLIQVWESCCLRLVGSTVPLNALNMLTSPSQATTRCQVWEVAQTNIVTLKYALDSCRSRKVVALTNAPGKKQQAATPQSGTLEDQIVVRGLVVVVLLVRLTCTPHIAPSLCHQEAPEEAATLRCRTGLNLCQPSTACAWVRPAERARAGDARCWPIAFERPHRWHRSL